VDCKLPLGANWLMCYDNAPIELDNVIAVIEFMNYFMKLCLFLKSTMILPIDGWDGYYGCRYLECNPLVG
jgi:hypothetical protein